MRCSAGYNEPSSTRSTSREIRWMCRVMPHPCMGRSVSVLSTSSSKLPSSTSDLRFNYAPLDVYYRHLRECTLNAPHCQLRRVPLTLDRRPSPFTANLIPEGFRGVFLRFAPSSHNPLRLRGIGVSQKAASAAAYDGPSSPPATTRSTQTVQPRE